MFEAAKAAFIETLYAHSSESFVECSFGRRNLSTRIPERGRRQKGFGRRNRLVYSVGLLGIWERTDAVFLRAFRSATADSSRKNKSPRTFEKEGMYENEHHEVRVAVPMGAAGCRRHSTCGRGTRERRRHVEDYRDGGIRARKPNHHFEAGRKQDYGCVQGTASIGKPRRNG